jgi:hypothetical protein
MTVAKDPREEAKRFIDASLKGAGKPPSKAAYARAVRLARVAIEELRIIATRARG